MTSSAAPSSSPRRLEGKVAIITGGASGIGESTAKLFARHGATVIVADIQIDKGHKVCKEINDNGGTAIFFHCDVTSESDIRTVVETAVNSHGKLDIMFNNAGILIDFKPLTKTDLSSVERLFAVNFLGILMGIKHAGRVMAERGAGIIINTASTTAICAGMSAPIYSASKHAVVGLTKEAAVELGRQGVRVNCVSPHLLASPLTLAGLGKDDKAMEEAVEKSGVLKAPALKAEDVAQAALYLASDESRYVNGINLVVDGGYSITNTALPKHLFSPS